MDWPIACETYASDRWTAKGFRRRAGVMQVVETLGITDGRHFAEYILSESPELTEDARIMQSCRWGDPLEAPSCLTGWPWSCSPTSLRYIAHAIWLKTSGLVAPNRQIVEIGAGFGGLAAMNALISGSKTHLVDLPPVIQCVHKMAAEIGLADFISNTPPHSEGYTFVSNYAFTELSPEWQDTYFNHWIRPSNSGMLISNANHFQKRAGNSGNDRIMELLSSCNMEAQCLDDHIMLGPSDRECRNVLIIWKRPDA